VSESLERRRLAAERSRERHPGYSAGEYARHLWFEEPLPPKVTRRRGVTIFDWNAGGSSDWPRGGDSS
jgi:hypothetical protein